jgi:hypothetical protein
VTQNVTAANVAAVRDRIATASANVRRAMRNAGYADTQWTLLGAELPVTDPERERLPLLRERLHPAEHGRLRLLERRRRLGQQQRAADHQRRGHRAAYGAGITNRRTLDLSSALNGQRLCESSVGLYEERSIADWRSSRRGRACVRQAYNGGTPRGGTCRISGTGLVGGEPRMSLS